MSINFEKIDKALAQLGEAISTKNISDLERDGTIQRFEYTIELLWKVAKKVLEHNGILVVAPKDVIREMASLGWLENAEEFINYLKMRNETSHLYKEDVATAVYQSTLEFYPSCKKLVRVLKEKSQ